MSNSLLQKPAIIDTDITSFRTSSGYLQGIRVTKLVLAVGPGGASTAGTVSITAPSDSAVLYPPLPVASAIAANTILFADEPTNPKGDLTWRDFAVTGVTATGTKLYLWYVV